MKYFRPRNIFTFSSRSACSFPCFRKEKPFDCSELNERLLMSWRKWGLHLCAMHTWYIGINNSWLSVDRLSSFLSLSLFLSSFLSLSSSYRAIISAKNRYILCIRQPRTNIYGPFKKGERNFGTLREALSDSRLIEKRLGKHARLRKLCNAVMTISRPFPFSRKIRGFSLITLYKFYME